MFGKKLSREQLTLVMHSTCNEYLKRLLSDCPDESDLEERATYLINAVNQARGMDFLAQKICQEIDDQQPSIPTAALLNKLIEMFEYNLSKIENR